MFIGEVVFYSESLSTKLALIMIYKILNTFCFE